MAYLRVSTATQAEEGHGLEVQEQAINRWAEREGHTIIASHRDEGISGAKDAGDRPALAAALAAVEDTADGLVVYKLDRLARTLSVQEAVLAQVWKGGGRVWSVDVGEVLQDDPDDPMRTAMRQMVGVFAQLERAMIAARMRAGRRLKASKGGYIGGQPRFGRRAEGRELVAHESEQETVGRIVQLHAEGRSVRQIIDALEAEGRRAKRGGRWHPETVARVLRRLDDAA